MPLPDADIFRTLADPTRRGLFERLAVEGELSVSDLTAQAGISQPAVSQHLAVLKASGLVEDRRDGRAARYRVRPEGLAPLTNWLGHYSVFWRERMNGLANLLDRMDQ